MYSQLYLLAINLYILRINFYNQQESVKQEGLLANLQERLIQTEQGAMVLSNSNVGNSSSQNTGLLINTNYLL